MFGVKLCFLFILFSLFLSFIVCHPISIVSLFSSFSASVEESEIQELKSDNLSDNSRSSLATSLVLDGNCPEVRISAAIEALGGVLFDKEILCLLTMSSVDLANKSGFPVIQADW